MYTFSVAHRAWRQPEKVISQADSLGQILQALYADQNPNHPEIDCSEVI